jgi:sugar O-acyltransferase (sialic acid O-acetyltransferase NeuD family)
VIASGSVLDLYILGAGGHARELHSYIEDVRKTGWSGRLCGFLDDGLTPGFHAGLEVLGPIDALAAEIGDRRAYYLTAFGSNEARRQIVRRITALCRDAVAPWTLIHPHTSIGQGVKIGAGTCLAPATIVTAQTSIGSHCILNVKASVSHDCRIGDFVNINPAATICGSVTVGEGAFIGAGAVVKERINIGAWSVIGAGAAVVSDIPANVAAVGVPARIVERTR